MGEVWKAIDTALDRVVTIKFEAFASDAERLARFECEAKVLATQRPVRGLHHALPERRGQVAVVDQRRFRSRSARRPNRGLPDHADRELERVEKVASVTSSATLSFSRRPVNRGRSIVKRGHSPAEFCLGRAESRRGVRSPSTTG